MKALSIREPWAGMIRNGPKTIETRTWYTSYRGPLLICASKKPESEYSGHAIAVVDLVDCFTMIPRDEGKACCQWYPGAWSWFLENIRPIKPIPVKGKQGLFEAPIELEDLEFV